MLSTWYSIQVYLKKTTHLPQSRIFIMYIICTYCFKVLNYLVNFYFIQTIALYVTGRLKSVGCVDVSVRLTSHGDLLVTRFVRPPGSNNRYQYKGVNEYVPIENHSEPENILMQKCCGKKCLNKYECVSTCNFPVSEKCLMKKHHSKRHCKNNTSHEKNDLRIKQGNIDL